MKRNVMLGCMAMVAAVMGAGVARGQAGGVSLSEDEGTYLLDNGIVQARVAKASGDLVSMKYKGMEMLASVLDAAGNPDLQKDPPGHNPNGLNRGFTDHQYGFWSHDAMGPRGTGDAIASVSIDPKSNNGQRAEISVAGSSKGRFMGTGPGAPATGQFACDIEIRYTLNAGDSGVYTYCIFDHPAEYPATSLGEARFCAKLNSFFDWLHAGDKYNKLYPKEQERGEDKYVYTTIQSQNPAFGWSSTTKQVGFFCINPSMEYMSGGPTKPEFLGHRDTNPVAAPCVLNYWRSSHYGGAAVDVAQGEHWTKVVGPFLLYVNSGAEPAALYADAKKEAEKEAAKWPFQWVSRASYPTGEGRSTVRGKLVLSDLQRPGSTFTNLYVGLSHAPWQTNPGNGAGGAPIPPRTIDWQQDAKYYQFWTRGKADGTFAIPNVRPGKYILRAFADGILGEFAQADISISNDDRTGQGVTLDPLTWTPVRRGRQLWEIGVPNRNASEFFKGDVYTQMDISLQYAKLFPDDIVYTIGTSDYKKDWFFQHVPHNTDPAAVASPFFGIRGKDGNACPRTIVFSLPSAPKGKATLRLAICGGGARQLTVAVNEKEAGTISRLVGDGVITRHQIQGIWYEKELPFDASMLKAGENRMVITVPGAPVNNGVLYDYLRLELDEGAQ